MTFDEARAAWPDHAIVRYVNRGHRSDVFPNGFECLFAIPIASIAAKPRDLEPWWKDGETIEIDAPSGDPGVKPVLQLAPST